MSDKIEGIPDGWELVRIVDRPQIGEYALGSVNHPVMVTNPDEWDLAVIVRKIETPKEYRPLANANDGGPAFPVVETDHVMGTRIDPGMTLRDYFAAQAMAAMLSLEQVHLSNSETEIAVWAYSQADAMLAVRSRSA